MAITALASLGRSDAYLIAACIAIAVAPGRYPVLVRTGLVAIAFLASLSGPSSLSIAVPIALALSGLRGAAASGLLVLSAVTLLGHHLQSLPASEHLTTHPGSYAFVVIPALAVATTFFRQIGTRGICALIASTAVALAIVELGAGQWFNHAVFVAPAFRILVALVPIVTAAACAESIAGDSCPWPYLVVGAATGAVVSLALPSNPISSISFDESHGKWETVQARFKPGDFGRAANYTYSLLFDFAKRHVGAAGVFPREDSPLPGKDAVFVLKMPTQPLSEAFSDRLETWVRSGGRLLVVADHTDLYDTTQNLNAFLSGRFGLRLAADAVFDSQGMPTVPSTEPFAALFGRVDAHNRAIPWQTGTSLSAMPINAVSLATFGFSFSEPGDYSRPNRFGAFVPRVSLRFADHVSIVAFGAGRGAIVAILDSTPWSNFSIFRAQYRQLFRATVHTLTRPVVLQVWAWGALALAMLAILSAVIRHPAVFLAAGLSLGLALGAAGQIGRVSFHAPQEGVDFGIRVAVGSSGKLEFLRQLVGVGERNFSRIISAMSKYGLTPSASTPGEEVPNLQDAKRWLLIQPDRLQLPDREAIIRHLKRGGDLTVLFAPDQAADPDVKEWLTTLGLYAQKALALGISEDARPGLLNRAGASIYRDVRAMTGAKDFSLLKGRESSALMQSYTVRPTTLPRTSGLLNIGFSADQFSDDAVGEVWEGVQPSSIGRLREQQLAAVLGGNDLPAPFPDGLAEAPPATPRQDTSALKSFVLMENGKTVLSGRFDSAPGSGSRFVSEDPGAYLKDLGQRAVAFIEAECPATARTTSCTRRLLGPDLIEWMVTWIANDNGQVIALELLHERRFSGLGGTWNVVIGE